MAFSIPKSPLQGWSGNRVACFHSQIPEKRHFLFPSRLSKDGLGMELPSFIPRFLKYGVFYSQVASPAAVWEWSCLLSFPKSRKTAISVTRWLSRAGWETKLPDSISQIPKIGHFCYPIALRSRLGNKTPGFHFPNPENQPFLLPDGSPEPVGKQNSRIPFPMRR